VNLPACLHTNPLNTDYEANAQTTRPRAGILYIDKNKLTYYIVKHLKEQP